MFLKQSKIMDSNHPDLMKLRRGLVEKSLWVTLVFCIILIGFLTSAVVFYKAKHLPSETLSKIGGKHLASTFLSKMNLSIEPCDDFYSFACGRFEETTIIPDDAGSINTINMIESMVLNQLHTLLNSEIHEKEIRPFKMAKKFYKQCMDTDQIEAIGLDFVIEKMNLNITWPVLSNTWNESFLNSTEYFRYIVEFFIDTDLKNSSIRSLYIGGPNLALGREMLLQGFSNNNVRSYHKYMVEVAIHFGASRIQAEEDFAKVLLFEMLLANITISKEDKRDSNKLYNPKTISELIEQYPYINWLPYINSKLYAGLKISENERVIVQQPSYLEQLEAIIIQSDKRTVANFIVWRELADYLPFLTSGLLEKAFEFFKSFSGRSTRLPRWSDCVKGVSSMLGIAVSSMYVREHFYDERIKHDIGEMVTEIRHEFKKLLLTNDWMDADTKEEALKKLYSMSSNIAYPKELLNDSLIEDYYKDLQLNETNYLQSAINIDIHGRRFVCSRYHQAADKKDWIDQSASTFVNANYNGKTNSIQIIAAMLQGHFYSRDRPLYMNYAGIGYVIGHELIHGYDDLGRLYDRDGNLHDWWHKAAKKAFDVKKRCIIEQFGNYTDKSTNMSLNGVISQGENIADTAGIKLAYRAYQSAVEKLKIKEPLLPGLPFTPEQLFWIYSAQTWCSVERLEVKKVLILTDNHSLSPFRVIGSLSNSRDFAKDFSCNLQSAMNPVMKCELW